MSLKSAMSAQGKGKPESNESLKVSLLLLVLLGAQAHRARESLDLGAQVHWHAKDQDHHPASGWWSWRAGWQGSMARGQGGQGRGAWSLGHQAHVTLSRGLNRSPPDSPLGPAPLAQDWVSLKPNQ